jgi:hypothetical protein
MFWRRHKKLAIALTCADWRLHQRKVDLNRRLARALEVDGVDMIVVPGPDGLLVPAREAEWKVALAQISLLIGAHTPVKLAVVAHQRCAGHPVGDIEHNHDVEAAAKALKLLTNFAGPVEAFVATYKSDTSWGLKPIATA